MFQREVVNTAGQPSDGALPGETVEGYVNGFPAADVEKIRWNKDKTASTAVDGRNYPRINRLW
jgi:hypothetical protein